VTAVWLGLYPIKKNSGVILFTSVIVFGLATIVFGLSGSVVLSVLALIVIGASDMISVYIRTSIVQLAVPDHIRGRVSALNMVSVGASNEVGEFRAGSVASIIGVVPAIVLGGVGALAIASIWLNLFPSLRKRDRLEQNG
jgi:MFS family permease